MKTQPTRPLEEDLKDAALEMAAYCVGFTIIDSGYDSKFSEEEMKAYNSKVVNKMYTYLYYCFKCAPVEDVRCFLELFRLKHLAELDRPELDKDMVAAVENMKELKGENPLNA